MNRNESLFTVYELYTNNGSEFPFWIKGSSSAQTCLMVVGWSKFVGAKTYQGVPIMDIGATRRAPPEMWDSKQEDFKESGTFVGIRYYTNKVTRTDPYNEQLLLVSGAASRSWLSA
ncbi:MAG: hypothetical protein V7785_18045 [Bermanella sp.]